MARARAALALAVGALVLLAAGVLVHGSPPAQAATAITATPAPCAPKAGACTVTPSALVVTFPGGVPDDVDAVDVAWATTGRPAGAPAPATDAVLTLASGACSGASCSWPWPAGLDVGGVELNGTYAVTPCSTSTSTTPPSTSTPSPTDQTSARTYAAGCTPSGTVAGATVALAVAPGGPGGFRVEAPSPAAGVPVTLSWTLGTAPDLAGYVATRNGHDIAICTLHAAVVGGSGPCGASPSIVDHSSGSGTLTYELAAVRYGASGGFTGGVGSAPVATTLSLQAPGTITPLHPAPVVGTPVIPKTPVPVGTAPSSGATAPGATTTTAPADTEPGPIAYPPGEGGSSRPLPAAVGATAGHPSDHGVGGIALVAGGLLVLAVACHLWYLRSAVGRYQAAHASGSTPPPTG